MKHLPKIAAALVGIVVLLMFALYVLQPSSDSSGESASVRTPARTIYPSIIPDPTWTPGPTADIRPLIVEVGTGGTTPLNIPNEYGVRKILSDGTLLLDSGTGPAPIFRTDGERLIDLPVPYGVRAAVTSDGRYVLWIADGHLQVYDATSESYRASPPPAGETYRDVPQPLERAGGGVLLPGDTRNVAGGQRGAIAIIDASGAVTGTVPSSDGADVSVAPDGRSFAWAQTQGIHIRTVATGEERVLAREQVAAGAVEWSPDSQRIAIERFTRADALETPCAQIAPECHLGIWLIELATGDERLLYQAPVGRRIDSFQFVDPHTIEYRMLSEALERYSSFLPGIRYRVADDGGAPRAVDPIADTWSTCGPRCGLPPEGYEDADGLARWVALQDDGRDDIHLAYVDRPARTALDLDSSMGVLGAALSPDRSHLAVIHAGADELVLAITSVADGSKQQVVVGHLPQVTWFPDSRSVLVYGCCTP